MCQWISINGLLFIYARTNNTFDRSKSNFVRNLSDGRLLFSALDIYSMLLCMDTLSSWTVKECLITARMF